MGCVKIPELDLLRGGKQLLEKRGLSGGGGTPKLALETGSLAGIRGRKGCKPG